jgi:serine/threonine protein phosphatase 1
MSIPVFSDDIEPDHLRLDADEWSNVYVIGDVHGCLSELEELLARLSPADDEALVFVGDLVRKGPDNHGVVDLVRSRDNMFTVRGNNEEKILRGEKDPDDLTAADREWIENRPVAISWEGHLVVHGGVDPRKPLAAHDVDDLQNTRSLSPEGGYERPFWWERYDGPDRVFFGHTPLAAPVLREHAVGLDTGCVYGGELTAFDVGADDLVTVDPDRTVEFRADDKFVSPRAVVTARQ